MIWEQGNLAMNSVGGSDEGVERVGAAFILAEMPELFRAPSGADEAGVGASFPTAPFG